MEWNGLEFLSQPPVCAPMSPLFAKKCLVRLTKDNVRLCSDSGAPVS